MRQEGILPVNPIPESPEIELSPSAAPRLDYSLPGSRIWGFLAGLEKLPFANRSNSITIGQMVFRLFL